jgi:hypothetical protein
VTFRFVQLLATDPGHGETNESEGDDVYLANNGDKASGMSHTGRRHTTTRYRRSGGLSVLAAAAAIVMSACSGGSGSPHVANLGTNSSHRRGNSTPNSSGTSATTLPTSDPTRLLDEWAACMRAHGDANQADPTITANKVIDITWDPAIPGGYNGTNKGGQGNSGPGQYCRAYLTAAQMALQGGQSPEKPDPAKLEKLSECMRANGVPDFPDPSGDTLSFNVGAGGDLNPNNPIFQAASRLCAQKTGLQGFDGATPQPGMIELNGAGPGRAGG